MIDLYKFNANLGHTDDNKSYHWSPFQIHKYKYKWNRENFQIRINESKLVYIMVFDAKSRFYFRILRGFMN